MDKYKKQKKAVLSIEEQYQRSLRAKRRFRAASHLVMANLSWLQDIDDTQLSDNVKRNIAVLTRKKTSSSSGLTVEAKMILSKPVELRTDSEKKMLSKMLGEMACFRRFRQDLKDQLPEIMHFTYYGPGRVIIKQNYEPLNMYVILSGQVVFSQTFYNKLSKEYDTKNVMVMAAGNFFGEVSMLLGTTRMATATTSMESEFLYCAREDFLRVFQKDALKIWRQMETDLSLFDYFKDWTQLQLREACILGHSLQFHTDQVILGGNIGEVDNAYFVIHGHCYVLEHIDIKTVTKRGITKYFLHSGDQKDSGVRTHFVQVCEYFQLACFNIGENLKNRVVVAGEVTECMVIPRDFLLKTGYLTFKAIQAYLDQHTPSTGAIFKKLVERRQVDRYRQEIINSFMAGRRKVYNTNTVHNVPYSIRIREDVFHK